MEQLILIGLVAFLASGITFFSGFGLGTMLFPVLALFLPIDAAIGSTAIVHLLNNLFKTGLIGGRANLSIVLRFGIPALLASFVGALLLGGLSQAAPLLTYAAGGQKYEVTPLKLIIGVLLFVFALFDLLPRWRQLAFPPRYIPLGGVLSGFFGGLSGHQGALRSAFLIKAGLSKESFIATGVIIAVIIDLARLTVYAGTILDPGTLDDHTMILVATAAAFAGAFLGNRLLRKVTIHTVQLIVGIALLIFSLAMMAGVL